MWDLDYTWRDGDWMQTRARRNGLDAPIAVYEVHLGSWRRVPEVGHRPLTYIEIAPLLADHGHGREWVVFFKHEGTTR